MLKKDLVVFDIETNGLNATKIHCFSYFNITKNKFKTLTKYEDIIAFLEEKEEKTYIGHNIIRYDFPTLERILNKDFSKLKKIDTLSLSFYVFNKRKKHGLESYGELFKVPKPVIKDWENQSIDDYINRCQTDVKINTILWKKQLEYLNRLYEDKDVLEKFLSYISFKTDCVREQESVGLKLNEKSCSENLAKLLDLKEKKMEQLRVAMPSIPIIKKQKVVKLAVKDDNGTIFSAGDLFFETVSKKNKIEEDLTIQKIVGYEKPNPNSVSQIKEWLDSLGWIPEHIKHVRHKKTKEVKKVPQISSAFIQGEVCDSVKKLFEKEPALEHLNGLSIISHRIGIFKSFLKEVKNGRLYPSMIGLTNTLRLQHSVVVNLPSVLKPYGEELRSCLMTDNEDTILCGSDLSNIEDRTKRHYIYNYDPQYVEDMNKEGYDAHLEIAILAGLLTRKQAENHINKIEDHTPIRQKSKVVNFSCTYKCGAETLARNSGFTLSLSKKLIDIYWKRNKAILDVENSLEIKIVDGQKWLKNPINNFYYSLRADKDKFSTLNQGKMNCPLIQKCIMKNPSNSMKLHFGKYRAKLRNNFFEGVTTSSMKNVHSSEWKWGTPKHNFVGEEIVYS